MLARIPRMSAIFGLTLLLVGLYAWPQYADPESSSGLFISESGGERVRCLIQDPSVATQKLSTPKYCTEPVTKTFDLPKFGVAPSLLLALLIFSLLRKRDQRLAT
jgi:hypothetical protein